MQTLLNRVRLLTKSTTSVTTDDQVLESIRGGCRYVMTSIPNKLLSNISESSVAVSGAGGIDVGVASEVISVYRNNYPSEQIPTELSYAFISSTTVSSLFKGTSMFPRHHIRDGRIYVNPAPTVSETVVVSYVKVPDISDATLSNNWKFGPMEDIVINYAAYLDGMSVASYYRNKLEIQISSDIADIASSLSNFSSAIPTWREVVIPSAPASPVISISYTSPSGYTLPESISLTSSLPTFSPSAVGISFTGINDALTKAENLIDATTMGGDTEPQSAQYWLYDEDPEMVTANINTAAQEINRARSEIEKQALYINEFSANLQSEVSKFEANINKYRAELEKEVSDVDSALKSYAAEQQDSGGTLNALIEDTRLGVQQWASESSEIINRYQSEVNAESQRFNMQIQKAMAYLQEAQVIIASAQSITLYAESYRSSIASADRFYRTARDLSISYQYKSAGVIPGLGEQNVGQN